MKRRWNWLMASVLAVSLLAGCGAAGGMKAENSYAMDTAETAASMPMEAPVAVEEAFDSGTGAVSVQRQQTQGVREQGLQPLCNLPLQGLLRARLSIPGTEHLLWAWPATGRWSGPRWGGWKANLRRDLSL